MAVNISCLLIDDDPDDREIFNLAMEKVDSNIRVIYARNGAEALNLLENNTEAPAFIFIDINMPLMNGFECLAKIKQIPALSKSGIYMYSTSNDTESKSLSRMYGARDYITKPDNFSALVNLLSGIFSKTQILR